MTITLQAVNELIAFLESAGELSIREQKYLDVMRWAIRVAGERDAALNAELVWEKTMMEACGEDGPASVANEIRSLRALRDTAIQALKSQVEQLSAENVALKAAVAEEIEVINRGGQRYCVKDGMSINPIYARGWNDHRANLTAVETPATDRFVVGIKADGVEEFAAMTEKVGDEEEFYDHRESSETLKYTAKQARLFAQQLRDGADK